MPGQTPAFDSLFLTKILASQEIPTQQCILPQEILSHSSITMTPLHPLLCMRLFPNYNNQKQKLISSIPMKISSTPMVLKDSAQLSNHPSAGTLYEAITTSAIFWFSAMKSSRKQVDSAKGSMGHKIMILSYAHAN